MKSAIIVAGLALFCAVVAEEHATAFCYRDADGCGPTTHAWAEVCHSGERQSPINLPANLIPFGFTKLRLRNAYKGNFFRMSNSGHSVSVDFVGESGQNEGPTGSNFPFPDPLNPSVTRNYKFSSAHFHWGATDNVGSEHTVGSRSSAMEAHFVHYAAKYPTLADAVASGDESALNVLGVMINVSKMPSFVSGLMGNRGHPSLAPIVKNLDQVHHASHDGGFVTVNQTIDFTPLIMNGLLNQVYTYKGSLTTPGCNEQVNWFVLKNQAVATAGDLQAFRSKLQDSNGDILNENHRPVLPLKGRRVNFRNVIAL